MPGPQPQPTAVKQARGNPGKRALNKREPKPLVGLPAPVVGLSARARAVWESYGPTLVRLGLMTELDGPAFEGLCTLEALFQRFAPNVDEMALMQEIPRVSIESGESVVERKPEPAFKELLEILKERRAQHAQFGMTPASRSKLTALGKGETDPLEDALRGMRAH